jgi:hypothetical protein
MTNFFKEGSLLSQVAAGVLTALVISMISFSLILYSAHQNKFDSHDAEVLRADILKEVEIKYSRADVAVIQNQAIIERLDRIEEKLDQHLLEY